MYNIGDDFITSLDEDRIKLQTKWEQMLHSLYIYRKVIDNTGKQHAVDPLIPLPAAVSEISSDLLFGERPVFDFQNEDVNKKLQTFFSEYEIYEDLLEAAVYLSAVGTLFWRLYKYQEKTYWEFTQANKILWEEDVRGELLNVKYFELIEKSKNGKENVYQIQEHTMNDANKYVILEYKVIVNTVDGKVKKVYDMESTILDMDFIPIIKIVNLGQMGVRIGKSDYQGKEQLFAEVDNRIDQNNWTLQENADPWKAVPPGVLDKHGRFRRTNGKMFEKGVGGADGNTVDIFTWDASLQASFEQIEKMIDMIFFTARISSPIAGREKGGQVESGRALKWRSINTLSMIQRKRRYWNRAISTFLEMLSKMESDLKNLPVNDLVIRWQDGLPMDDTERTEIIVNRVTNGLLSKLSGIQRLDEVDETRANEEMEQINKEQSDEARIEQQRFTVTV